MVFVVDDQEIQGDEMFLILFWAALSSPYDTTCDDHWLISRSLSQIYCSPRNLERFFTFPS